MPKAKGYLPDHKILVSDRKINIIKTRKEKMGIIRAGIIADTHLGGPTRELADLLKGPFREVEVILHAGDLTEMSVLDAFAGKEVVAVCGNMDARGVHERLPAKRLWQAGKFRIGLIHGWGGKQGLGERVRGEFGDLDCLVYGHTHVAESVWRNGVYFFNPGSFSGPANAGRSVGLLELGETITGKIYALETGKTTPFGGK
jgi:hypothetical protein